MNNKKMLLWFRATLIVITLQGCAAVGTATSIANIAMEASGMKKQELPDAQKPARTLSINLHASEKLNVDANGKSLALVVKLYKLRQNAAFQQASYETFLDPTKEKLALSNDLLEVKEITLIPGQQFHAEEKVTREAYFIGVVGLFRKPGNANWRATFSPAEVEKTGITLGLHACSLTVGIGATVNTDIKNTISSIQC